MADSAILVRKNDLSFMAATEKDRLALARFKPGDSAKFTITKASARSAQHNRLYWGGLIALTFDYWNPTAGNVAKHEAIVIDKFSAWLDSQSNSSGAFKHAGAEFLRQLSESRGEKIQAPNATPEQLHEEIKEEAGYFDWVRMPDGVKKVVRSISFAKMSQDEFNVYYRRAFDVCWRMVLSRKFDDEEQAQLAIDAFLRMT